jgi:hemerythrin
MIQVAHMHFTFEEAIMRMFGFPGLKAHKREHQIFFDKLNNFEKQALRTSVDAEISHFLTDWLKEQVFVSDRGYVAHIFSGSHVVIPEFNPI